MQKTAKYAWRNKKINEGILNELEVNRGQSSNLG
jgi:hypothetical protein